MDEAHASTDIERDITELRNLAHKLRARRFETGALSLESPTLSFKLDENGLPTDCGQYERTEANTLIEEVNCPIYSFYFLLTCFASSCFLRIYLLLSK